MRRVLLIVLLAMFGASAAEARTLRNRDGSINFYAAQDKASATINELLSSARMAPYFPPQQTGPLSWETNQYYEWHWFACSIKRCQFGADLYAGTDATGRFVGRARVTVRILDPVRYGWVIPPIMPQH